MYIGTYNELSVQTEANSEFTEQCRKDRDMICSCRIVYVHVDI